MRALRYTLIPFLSQKITCPVVHDIAFRLAHAFCLCPVFFLPAGGAGGRPWHDTADDGVRWQSFSLHEATQWESGRGFLPTDDGGTMIVCYGPRSAHRRWRPAGSSPGPGWWFTLCACTRACSSPAVGRHVTGSRPPPPGAPRPCESCCTPQFGGYAAQHKEQHAATTHSHRPPRIKPVF
jgi:hypothetical protein